MRNLQGIGDVQPSCAPVGALVVVDGPTTALLFTKDGISPTIVRMAKRKHRPRPDAAGEVKGPDGFPDWEHGQYTFEGEIERLGAVGRNMSTAPRWTRVVARVIALSMLLPFVVGLLVYVVRSLTG